MMSAKPATPRKPYVVKHGYVYADLHGNAFRPGQTINLTDKEYDLSRHRLKPYVEQVMEQVSEMVSGPLEGEDEKDVDPCACPEPTPEQLEAEALGKLLGPGQYEIK